jgi:glutamate formiminotransferase / 5-formyltetrahydrofolate cyclo-ligase
MPLIECVPNVSEGRRPDIIAAIASAIDTPGVHLLDRSSDRSHNRTVFTFAGEASAVQEAVLRLFAAAVAAIDLRHHDGVHPRIGAVDVVPFVPLHGATMEQCVSLARTAAEQIADRLGVPMFLYEEAATTEDRRNLAAIRRGGVDGVALRMQQVAWQPDYGPDRPHPTAGATAIGARPILIAYNVNLATNRLGVAKRIASVIRTSSGGLAHVKAMGVQLEGGIAQVSMNLTNYRETSMVTVFDAVAREAAVDGVRVLESEIVGLVPADALPADPVKRLKLRGEDIDRVLEKRLDREKGKAKKA